MMLVSLLLLACTSTTPPQLEDGQRAMAAFEYERAIELLETARAKGGYAHDDHVALYEHLGVAYASVGRVEESEAAFEMLLALNPGHAISYTLAPKITFVFDRARSRSLRGGEPLLDVSWPRGLRTSDHLPITLEVVSDPAGLFHLARVHWRRGGGDYREAEIDLPPLGRYTSVLLAPSPVPAQGPETVDLHVVVLDAKRNEVFLFGSAEEPRRIELAHEQRTPWYGKWWVWGLAAGVVAAGSGAAVYMLTREPDPTVPGNLEVRL